MNLGWEGERREKEQDEELEVAAFPHSIWHGKDSDVQ
jgi:hypothetical protein